MNERVMQFRLGMFVIVAGLVLTMLVVWFGESPQLLRERGFVKVHFDEAPDIAQGVSVRKSGLRVGEVAAVEFDDRPDQGDGVLATLSLERRFKLRAGSVPRLNRSIIGDVTIDLISGVGGDQGPLETGATPAEAPIIKGEAAPDPSRTLATASEVLENAGDILKTIQEAAVGLARISQLAGRLQGFLATWEQTGKDISTATVTVNGFVNDNQEIIKRIIAEVEVAVNQLNATLDPATQDSLKTGIAKLSTVAARLDAAMADASPLMKDLGAPVDRRPTTDAGQAVRRLNRIAADLELLTNTLRDEGGGLNADGTVQRLLTRTELYDNANSAVLAANQTIAMLRGVLASFRDFAEKVARDPGLISRGALGR